MQAAYKTTVANGKKYISTVSRGVEYTLMRQGEGWGVASRRQALGRFNAGGFKSYETFDAVRTGCKAFAALPITSAM